MPMAEPVRARDSRTDEPWERGLYLLLLVVAIVVILYSLFGIATLLGYLPLSQSGGGGKAIQHPAVEARPALDRMREKMPTGHVVDVPCPPRASVKVTALAPSISSAPFAEPALSDCAEVESDRLRARNAAAAYRSYDR